MCRNHTHLLRFILAILFLFGFSSAALAQWAPMNPVIAVQPQPDGATFTMKSGTLRLQVCSDSIIHVLYSPTASFPASRPDPVVSKHELAGNEVHPAGQPTTKSR
jgi:hypothetical protein